jgi:hypothetical protein
MCDIIDATAAACNSESSLAEERLTVSRSYLSWAGCRLRDGDTGFTGFRFNAAELDAVLVVLL